MSDFSFYQLSRDPFAKSLAAGDAYETADMREARGRLDFLSRTGGIGLVCANPGYGKTLAVRSWAASLNSNVTRACYMCLTTVTTMEFYRQLCVALGLEPAYKKVDMFRSIQDHLRYTAVEKRVQTVVVVDEAQYLSAPILRDLIMLTNFEMDSRNCVGVALVGQPWLADQLSRGAWEALRQRIVVNYTFAGLSAEEARGWVAHAIRLAGGAPSVVDAAAVDAAYGLCGGSARKLGTLMSCALRIGAQQRSPQVTAEMVMAASEEVSLR